MFTGIIEMTAEVAGFEATGAGGRLTIRAPRMAGDLEAGESVAVNGCCLTVTGTGAGESDDIFFDLLGETLRVTNLGRLQPGKRVNLERALRAGDRMSGHYVQGHVDCAAEVRSFERAGEDHRLEIELPRRFSNYVVSRGSIAVNGISLTVAEVEQDSFVTWIIPHTFEVTNLAQTGKGDFANLEFDILAKYVERHVANWSP